MASPKLWQGYDVMALADAALKHYDCPSPIRLSLVNISENATFLVEMEGERYALRIHRPGYHSSQAIASELEWITALKQSGQIETPLPLPGRDDQFIQEIDLTTDGQPVRCVLFDWLTGSEPGIAEDLTRPFQVLGEVTARMHLHSINWKRSVGFTRFAWDFESSLGEAAPHWGHWRNGLGIEARHLELFSRTVSVIGERLLRYGREANQFGMIHADLRLANLLVDGDAVKVIDFDDCGFGWFMYDAATPISFYEHLPNTDQLIGHWLEGYQRVRTLSAEDVAEIPTFIMLRRLLLIAWIGSHSETDLAQSMGHSYTDGSLGLCENYLVKYG